MRRPSAAASRSSSSSRSATGDHASRNPIGPSHSLRTLLSRLQVQHTSSTQGRTRHRSGLATEVSRVTGASLQAALMPARACSTASAMLHRTGLHGLARSSMRTGQHLTASRVYCGRKDDVAAVRTWLDSKEAPPNLLVTAPAGRGKSALLVRLALSLAERDDLMVIFIPVSLRYDTDRPDVFLGCLVARLCGLARAPAARLHPRFVPVLQGVLLDDLDRPSLMDASWSSFSMALTKAAGWTLRRGLLKAEHPRTVRVIVSARHRVDDLAGDRWLHDLGTEARVSGRVIALPLP